MKFLRGIFSIIYSMFIGECVEFVVAVQHRRKCQLDSLAHAILYWLLSADDKTNLLLNLGKSFRMAPPLFHSIWNNTVSNLPQWDIHKMSKKVVAPYGKLYKLKKWLFRIDFSFVVINWSHWGIMLFHIEWKTGGAMQKLFRQMWRLVGIWNGWWVG